MKWCERLEMRANDDAAPNEDVPRGIGIESAIFEAFINRWKILEGRPCRVRVRHGDGEEEESKVVISVRQVSCEKRNERWLEAAG